MTAEKNWPTIGAPGITLRGVTVRYEAAETDSLSNIDFSIAPGEIVSVTGPSGCGKSTLISVVNGLIPHLYGASVTGDVNVLGFDPQVAELADSGRSIATVFQNPRTQFFCDDSTSEMAFALENVGTAPEIIRRRIAEASEELGVVSMLGRPMSHLSGGQKQAVALAGCVVREPSLFVLDEPTSNLDTQGIQAVRELLGRLRQAGATVLICEHRLSFLAGLVDRVVCLAEGRVVSEWSGEEFFALSDDDPRRWGLRSGVAVELPPTVGVGEQDVDDDGLVVNGLSFRYGRRKAPSLVVPSLQLRRGKITALVGPNGAGKSTLLRILAGLSSRFEGEVRLDGRPLTRRGLRECSYVVMQDVNRQLFAASVADEVQLGAHSGVDTHGILESLGLVHLASMHPQALSGGQRQRLAIATAEASCSEVVLFDEPTSGLDRGSMLSTAALLRRLADAGRVVVVVTHDEELVEHCADEVVRLGPSQNPSSQTQRITLEESDENTSASS